MIDELFMKYTRNNDNEILSLWSFSCSEALLRYRISSELDSTSDPRVLALEGGRLTNASSTRNHTVPTCLLVMRVQTNT